MSHFPVRVIGAISRLRVTDPSYPSCDVFLKLAGSHDRVPGHMPEVLEAQYITWKSWSGGIIYVSRTI